MKEKTYPSPPWLKKGFSCCCLHCIFLTTHSFAPSSQTETLCTLKELTSFVSFCCVPLLSNENKLFIRLAICCYPLLLLFLRRRSQFLLDLSRISILDDKHSDSMPVIHPPSKETAADQSMGPLRVFYVSGLSSVIKG